MVQVLDREAAQTAFKEASVPTAVHYPVPLYSKPAFDYVAASPSVFTNCKAVREGMVSLPVHLYMSEHDAREAVLEVARVFG